MNTEEIIEGLRRGERRALARAITVIEDGGEEAERILGSLPKSEPRLVIGVTGPPGSGKSTLIGALAKEFASRGRRVGVIAVDPSSRITGGAVLGDRVRMMDAGAWENIYIRSLATRGGGSLSEAAENVIKVMAAAGIELIFIETVGSGQHDLEVLGLADIVLLVLSAGAGDEIQGLKSGLAEVSDIIVVNKADRPGAESLLTGLRIAFQEKAERILKVSAARSEGVEALADLIEGYVEGRTGKDRRILREALVEKAMTRLRRLVEEEAEKYLEGWKPGDEHAVEEIIRRVLRRVIGHEG